MAVTEFSPPTLSLIAGGTEYGGRTAVRLQGEHDASTAAELHATLARAIALREADLVVDMSDVAFIDAATIGAIVRARNDLLSQSRSLMVRAPAGSARRIFELCHMDALLETW